MLSIFSIIASFTLFAVFATFAISAIFCYFCYFFKTEMFLLHAGRRRGEKGMSFIARSATRRWLKWMRSGAVAGTCSVWDA